LEEIKDTKITRNPAAFKFSHPKSLALDEVIEKSANNPKAKTILPPFKLRNGEQEPLNQIREIMKEKGIKNVEDAFLIKALRGKKYFSSII